MTIDREALTVLWQQAFGDARDFVEGFFRTGFSRERCRFLERDGKPVAALYWFDCRWDDRKLAYIYAVATDKSYRGQGLCRRLMADTHRHLQVQGYAGAVLVPGDAGLFTMYEKLGYRGFCPMERRVILPDTQPICPEAISPEEYAHRKEKLLPRGGIAQDGAVLDFYGTYGTFYRFDGGVFCAAREQETLYLQEYLGNADALGGIVKALDAQQAKVRLPGGEKPFAMYYGFTEENEMPTYLGVALD